MTSVRFIRATTVLSTIMVRTKSPTSAVSPPVLMISIPYFLYSSKSDSVPPMIALSTSPVIKPLLRPIVELSMMFSVAPTQSKSSIFMINAS